MDFKIIILLIFSYIIGSIPFAFIIGKVFFNLDIRKHGSGNIGTTNTFRILGTKAGIVVLICDFFKGAIPVYIAMMMHVDIPYIIFGACAAIGHVFPIFLKFKGGKAVATGAGVILAVSPTVFTFLFIGFFITLLTFKYVSLASMVGVTLLLILSFIYGDMLLIIVSIILFIIIIYKHIPNIKRIINKTEPKVSFLTKDKKRQ